MPLKKVKGKQIDRRMAREAAMKNTVHCACTARALCVHRAALRVHCAALRVHCATSTALLVYQYETNFRSNDGRTKTNNHDPADQNSSNQDNKSTNMQKITLISEFYHQICLKFQQ